MKFKTSGIDFEKYRYRWKKSDSLIYFWFNYDKNGHISICFKNNSENKGWEGNELDNKTNRPFMLAAVNVAKKLGYMPYKDEEWLKSFKSIKKYHRWSSNGKVNFEAEYYPAGGKLGFWATGRRYCITNCYEGIRELPYLEHLRIKLLFKKIKKKWESMGAECVEPNDPKFKYAYDKVAHHKYSCCHWRKEHDMKDIFSQQYTNGDEPASYNSKAKDDQVPLRNGQLKYFYDYHGRLRRGYITHNINNMWWVVCNDFDAYNISSGDFFDFESLERTPLKKKNLTKINRYIKEAVKNKDYLKAHVIQTNNFIDEEVA